VTTILPTTIKVDARFSGAGEGMKNDRTSMILLASTLIRLAAATLIAQTPAAKKPSFDVISVKRDKTGGRPRRTGAEGNRVYCRECSADSFDQFGLPLFHPRPVKGTGHRGTAVAFHGPVRH
jgi:hypothetical protein